MKNKYIIKCWMNYKSVFNTCYFTMWSSNIRQLIFLSWDTSFCPFTFSSTDKSTSYALKSYPPKLVIKYHAQNGHRTIRMAFPRKQKFHCSVYHYLNTVYFLLLMHFCQSSFGIYHIVHTSCWSFTLSKSDWILLTLLNND